jgi:hypothetical protein
VLEVEAIDYIAICRLQESYADAVTRRAWEEFDELFMPSAAVRVDTVTNPAIELIGGRAVAEFIASAIDRFEFFEFVILNRRIEFPDGAGSGRAVARVFTCELRQETASGHWTNTFGVYHDTYEQRDDRWRFATRRYQSLARTGRAVVFPYPAAEDAFRDASGDA